MKFKIDWKNTFRALQGDNFEYSGKIPESFLEELKRTNKILYNDNIQTISNEIEKSIVSTIDYQCRDSVNTITNKEEFLDKLISRINKKQLK